MQTVKTRIIAEHLSTLAMLLEAEAMKAGALGMPSNVRLKRDAAAVRTLADQLWSTDAQWPLGTAANPVPIDAAAIGDRLADSLKALPPSIHGDAQAALRVLNGTSH